MKNESEKYQGTENYLWNKFETAIDEQFLSGAVMPTVEEQYQPLADALGYFWQHASSPRVQAMKLLATHPLFAKYPYQTEIEADYVVIKIAPATKWFCLEIAVYSESVTINVLGDKHTAYGRAILFNRKGLIQDAPKLLNWWGIHDNAAYFAIEEKAQPHALRKAGQAQNDIIPDYTMILHALVTYGLDVCERLENAIVETAKQF